MVIEVGYEVVPYEGCYAVVLKGRIVLSPIDSEADAKEVCEELNRQKREDDLSNDF